MQIKTTSLAMVFAIAAGLVACSNDQTIEQDLNASSTISYTAQAATSGRAAAIYNNTNVPSSFYVWATFTDATKSSTPVVYFNNDVVTKSGSTYQGVGAQYWTAKPMSFYAIAGISATSDITNWSWGNTYATPSFGYTLKNATANQQDLMYATNINISKPTNGIVPLNFRHALSQIAFKVKVDHPDLYVNIKNITVNNVSSTGVLTLPNANTSTNVGTSATGYAEGTTLATWTTSGQGDYSISFAPTGQTYATVKYNETLAGNDVMMLLPGDYSASKWATGKAPSDTEVYFAIECDIYHKAGDATQTAAAGTSLDVALWQGSTTKLILIPASLVWQPGRKYTYTFVFGKGNGGYDSENPTNPVLDLIEYTWTSDEWIETSGTDVDMKTNS